MIKDRAEDVLTNQVDIKLPETLFKIADELRELISRGLLVQTGGSTPIDSLKRGEPFPDDIVDMEFETLPDRTKYELFCDTYHGRGQFWRDGHRRDRNQ
jgi:hypothetical protein